MAVKHANTLKDDQLQRLLDHVAKRTNHPERDRVMVLLSFKAALRSCEIAGLDWDRHLLDADGVLNETIWIGSDIAKNGKERTVPVHPLLADALMRLRRRRLKDVPVIYSPRKYRMTANGVTVWFFRLYEAAGFKGCSSHSGRRTFITKAARIANMHGKSLRDVQRLAGHADLSTTEDYIDFAESADDLVSAL